jgi:hypothetical protein
MSGSPNQLNAVATTDLLADGQIKYIGTSWCLCPDEWDVDGYITIQSSQGRLAFCAVGRVARGPNHGKLRYEPLLPSEIPNLSADNALSKPHEK